MKTTTLIKEEFITRSMAGEVFILEGCRYFYAPSKENPFRVDYAAIGSSWCYMDGITLFEVEEPKPIIERRWKWRKDSDGCTIEDARYMSDEFIEHYAIGGGWYKVEDLYIDVEIKND